MEIISKSNYSLDGYDFGNESELWDIHNHSMLPDDSVENENNTMVRSNLRWTVYYLDLYVVPVIILIGLIGNALSFIVFIRTQLKILSSSVYLAALALSDNGFLLCVFVGWLVNVNFNFYQHQGLCQLYIYLTYVFGCLSVWYIVAFTVERFIVVCFPLQRSLCTPRRARIVVIGLALLATVMYFPLLWTSRVDTSSPDKERHMCHPVEGYETYVKVNSFMDTVLTLIIPSLLIIVMNMSIICRIIRTQKLHHDETINRNNRGLSLRSTSTTTFTEIGRQDSDIRRDTHRSSKSKSTLRLTLSSQSWTKSSRSSSSSRLAGPIRSVSTGTFSESRTVLSDRSFNSHSSRSRSANWSSNSNSNMRRMEQGGQITKLLLVVSTIFLLLNLPNHVIRIHVFITRIFKSGMYLTVTYQQYKILSQIIYYINFSVNFLLYNMCGKNFREALKGLIKCKYQIRRDSIFRNFQKFSRTTNQ